MESALYGIFTVVGEVSEISLARCAHSFDFRYFTDSCETDPYARAFHVVVSILSMLVSVFSCHSWGAIAE